MCDISEIYYICIYIYIYIYRCMYISNCLRHDPPPCPNVCTIGFAVVQNRFSASQAVVLIAAPALRRRTLSLVGRNDEPQEGSASTTVDVVSSHCKDRALFVGLELAMMVPSFTM